VEEGFLTLRKRKGAGFLVIKLLLGSDGTPVKAEPVLKMELFYKFRMDTLVSELHTPMG